MKTVVYKEKNHGITRESTEFFKRHISRIGMVQRVEGKKEGEDYWVTFSDTEGNKIIVSGFSWGYYGEGPRALYDILQELGLDCSMEDVVSYSEFILGPVISK